METYTIYDHPIDFPDYYVARKFIITANKVIPVNEDFMVNKNLELIREIFRNAGLYCIDRDESDDPKIIETWI